MDIRRRFLFISDINQTTVITVCVGGWVQCISLHISNATCEVSLIKTPAEPRITGQRSQCP